MWNLDKTKGQVAKNVRYNVRYIDFFHIFYFYWREENLRYTLNFDIQSFRYIEVPLYKDWSW